MSKQDAYASAKREHLLTNLRCEYMPNPLGIDVILPGFSWILSHSERGQVQSAYQVLVASSRENLDTNNGDTWDSHKVVSDQSVNVVYKGSSLESGKAYYWKVCFWDKDNKKSLWSDVNTFEMGLLTEITKKLHFFSKFR